MKHPSLGLILLLVLPCPAFAQTLSDDALSQIRFDQKLNTQISLALPFRDEAGREVRLSEYFGQKPVILVLGYYQCPMLCTLVLNGMMESAADMKWSIGKEFEIIDVSVNPRETPALAATKKRAYVKRYGQPSAVQGWHFLTGNEPAIRQLASEVGFHYAYDPASKEFAHASGLIILTPEGKVSRYLFGVAYPSKDLYEALRTASSNNIGSRIREFVLLCFHYNPIRGKYSGTIMVVLRSLSAATLLGFVVMIAVVSRRGRSPGAQSSSSARCDDGQVRAELEICAPTARNEALQHSPEVTNEPPVTRRTS